MKCVFALILLGLLAGEGLVRTGSHSFASRSFDKQTKRLDKRNFREKVSQIKAAIEDLKAKHQERNIFDSPYEVLEHDLLQLEASPYLDGNAIPALIEGPRGDFLDNCRLAGGFLPRPGT